MRVRKAQIHDAAEIARVNVDTWRSGYRGIITDDFLASLSYEDRELHFKEFIIQDDTIAFAYIAEDEQEGIIGFTIGGKEREGIWPQAGEVYALYVSESWQKQGVGRMLLRVAADFLVKAGISSLMLWTLEAGSATDFYTRLDGKLITTKVFTVAGVDTFLVAYGWDDINILL